MWKKGLDIFGNLTILSRETVLSKYPHLPEIIAQRSTPGILIFMASGEPVYINAEAREVLISMGINGNTTRRQQETAVSIPETITNLCNQLHRLVLSNKPEITGSGPDKTPTILALSSTGADVFSFRAFFLSNSPYNTSGGSYILVLVERASPTKKFNIQKVVRTFRLSKRETQVLELVVQGLKNKEIAERLCVCVYTIEDHLKKIMKKMQVGNRTSIIAKLLEP
jgi:DNA-binding CsgD family transcriptional regulator